MPTSQVVAIINGNEPLSEVMLIDKEQEIQVTIKDANQTEATRRSGSATRAIS